MMRAESGTSGIGYESYFSGSITSYNSKRNVFCDPSVFYDKSGIIVIVQSIKIIKN